MPVVTEYLDDFSAGEIDARSALEFAEYQWRSLKGIVFDNDRRLRAQWQGAEWSAEIVEEGS